MKLTQRFLQHAWPVTVLAKWSADSLRKGVVTDDYRYVIEAL